MLQKSERQHLNIYNTAWKQTEVCVQSSGHFLHRGQISRDYEQEFPSVEVGPQLLRRCNKDSQATLCKQVSYMSG